MQDPFQFILPNIEVPQCKQHNEPCIFAIPDQSNTKILFRCRFCIPNLKSFEAQIQENKEIFFDLLYKNKRRTEMLDQIQETFRQFLSKITQYINKLIKLIKDQIEQIKTNQIKLNELAIQSRLLEMNPIIKMNQFQNKSFQEFIKQIREKIKIINTDLLPPSYQQNVLIQNNEYDKKKYQYSQVINSIQQNDDCVAIAMSSDNSIVAASLNNSIRIFQFEREKLKEFQQLNYHSNQIKCLTFMRKSQQLISGCLGGQIIIWDFSSYQQWRPIKLLNAHQDGIYCLVINQNEDMIISGSKIVKFWRLETQFWKCDQTLVLKDIANSLSLNESNTKMIISIWNLKQIKIFEKTTNQWFETQMIKIISFRLCFVDDNQFAVQQVRDQLQFFDYDNKQNQFILGQNISVKNSESDWNYFPMQYNKQKGILIDKNGQYINVLKKRQNQFTLEQIINIENGFLFGCVSDDGQYLFTWDRKSYQIQVRKLEII